MHNITIPLRGRPLMNPWERFPQSPHFLHPRIANHSHTGSWEKNEMPISDLGDAAQKDLSKMVTSSCDPDRWASAFSQSLEAVDELLRPPCTIPDLGGDIHSSRRERTLFFSARPLPGATAAWFRLDGVQAEAQARHRSESWNCPEFCLNLCDLGPAGLVGSDCDCHCPVGHG